MVEVAKIMYECCKQVCNEKGVYGFNRAALYSVMTVLFIVVVIYVCTTRTIRRASDFIIDILTTKIRA